MSPRRNDIAVIGMAGRFPEARDVEQWFANLAAGRDSVRPISDKRIAKTALARRSDYVVCGYLEDIDEFDFGYFQIPLGEARTMGPELRLLLEVVHETVENAGYRPPSLRGQRVSLFLNAIYSDYYRLADEAVPTLVTGNAPSFVVARIARQFHFTGSAVVVDASCSSSLAALHLACNEIALGDATSAIVCGANLYPIPTTNRPELLDVWSPSGKSKAFSAAADGMSRGEVVAAVMLKPLETALADGDRIRAVIRGTAINNNGTWSSSPAAPDSRAQAEVIRTAWRKAGVDPRRIGYVEAHGSGTPIGDALEVEGLDRAFREHTTDRRFCAISTGKSNVGSGMNAGGISGFIRAVLALERGVLFPTPNFAEPNPVIDWDHSAVYVNERLAPWTTSDGESRLAGVSSVAMSGINAHVVLGQAPAKSDLHARGPAPSLPSGPWLVTASSQTAAGLARTLGRLRDRIDRDPALELADVAYTQNVGRAHHRFRFAAIAHDLRSLRSALDEGSRADTTAAKPLEKLVLVFSDQPLLGDGWVAHFSGAHAAFRQAWHECEETFGAPLATTSLREAAFQYALYKTLVAHGVESWNVLGTGVGKHVADVATGTLTLAEALKRAAAHRVEPIPDFERRVQSLLQRETASNERCAFLGMGPAGELVDAIERRSSGGSFFALSFPTPRPESSSFLATLRALYLAGLDIDWDGFGQQIPGARIELPTYAFTPSHVWIREEPRNDSASAAPTHARRSAESVPGADVRGQVERIWRNVLGCDALAPNDHFFALGGHSLLAMQVLSRANTQFGLNLRFEHLWNQPTLGAFADLVAREGESARAKATCTDPGIAKVPEQSDYPVTPSQRRLWILDRLGDGAQAYQGALAYLLRGPVVVGALKQAFADVVERHESLRTVFVEVDGEPRQRVVSPGAPGAATLAYDDIGDESRARQVLAEAAGERTDLIAGPLVRAKLVRLGEGAYVFCLFFHHIVSDGWSIAVLFRDLLSAYRARLEGRREPGALPIQYRDYAQWLNERLSHGDLAASREYWLTKLGGDRPVLDLWTDGRRTPMQTFEGDMVRFALPAAASEALKARCRAADTTLFMGLYALLLGLLHRYTAQREFLIGSPVAGRTRQILEDQIGFYVNTVCLRAKVSPGQSFSDVLATARATVLEAQQHQEFPFDRVLEALRLARDMSRAPVFDVMLILQNATDVQLGEAALPGLSVEGFDLPHSVSKFDLTFEFTSDRNGIACRLEYNRRLFGRSRVEAMAEQFAALAAEAAAFPGRPLAELDLGGERDKSGEDAIAAGSAPDVVTTAFAQRASESPDAVALVEGGAQITFRALQWRARGLAARLLRSGVGPEVPVPVLLERSELLVTSVLAIAETGGVYVPLDPSWPDERIAFVLSALNPRVVLTRSTLAARLGPSAAIARSLDAEWSNFDDEVGDRLAPQIRRESPLYLLYTSGSTGNPKGVLGLHGATMERLHFLWARYPSSPDDVFCLRTPIGFVDAIGEMLGPLLSGARAVIASDDVVKDPKRLWEALQTQGVTSITLVPSHLRSLLEAHDVSERDLPSLRRWVVSGELLPADLVRAFRRRFPGALLVNLYGASEAAGDSTLQEVRDADADPVPAGRPIARTGLRVLGAHLESAPRGVRGEIYVAGPGLARGYFGRPDLTAAAFVPDPTPAAPGDRMYRTGDIGGIAPSGELYVFGRRDGQVKIRGSRVEPAEVETALRQHDALLDVAVIGEGANGHTELVAYCVAKRGEQPGEVALRRFARAKLPDYMVPARIVSVAALPRNANGKVDRRALTALARVEDSPPKNGTGSSDGAALREALRAMPDITDFAVVSAGADPLPVLFVEGSPDLSVWALRKHLVRHVATDQVPARIVPLPQLPRTPDGLVDIARLRADLGHTDRPERVEQQIAAIWKEVLGIPEVHDDETFLDLGGDSLASVRVTSLVAQKIGADVSPRDVLFQTVRQTAAACLTSLDRAASPSPAPSAAGENG